MLPSFLRPVKTQRRPPLLKQSSDPATSRDRKWGLDFARLRGYVRPGHEPDTAVVDEEDVESEEDALGGDEAAPLLPIFSAAHLDSIPVYDLTHSIRVLIVQRCETTLSWEQLRSPQISQFLVKPVQQQIRTAHFSRATIYALLANCLQFNKEGQANPGNVGVLRTRGLIAELVAVRLLKEFTTRELIDALSYDFDPLKGITPPPSSHAEARLRKGVAHDPISRSGTARTSTLEVAIKAQAKRFLAHPLVVQHLEAIWAGSIVFHSAADSLHRYPMKPPPSQRRHYGATHQASEDLPLSTEGPRRTSGEMVRRSVTLYDPNDASLLKLSRLRVPRYRQFFSTLSFAVMLGLFLAVLFKRSLSITPLEIVFWFWGAGFMLDEIVGFSEQGFGLYLMSVWNAFDIGILLLFCIYYILRLYGIIMADAQKQSVANMAYDVLASTAVLLFPRLFSVLDHYRYFSQLFIAFRLMAQDLAAILILIVIACSGFFVAFTVSFVENQSGLDTGYILFQVLMGYTPAAWMIWDEYNVLGKLIMTLFLIICHFLVVTILITVLTNSFMAIVKNANEEHQFLFAVNVLSMVKSDALFSYIAPSNIIGWLFSPLRYVVPFRQYVRVNRTIIKVTHFPVLFLVFAYERLRLSHYAYEPTKLIEQRGRETTRPPTFAQMAGSDAYTSTVRVREPSVTTRYKDRALEEVFRQPYGGELTVGKSATGQERGGSVVSNWMSNIGGMASPPPEQPRSILEQLESPQAQARRSSASIAVSSKMRSFSRSMMSDPEDRSTRLLRTWPRPILEDESPIEVGDGPLLATDGDGDDELATNDEDEVVQKKGTLGEDYAARSMDPGPSTEEANTQGEGSGSTLGKNPLMQRPRGKAMRRQDRQASVNTIVFNPVSDVRHSSSSSPHRPENVGVDRARTGNQRKLGIITSPQTPKRTSHSPMSPSRPRPILPIRASIQSTPDLERLAKSAPYRRSRHASAGASTGLRLASDIGDNQYVGFAGDDPGYSAMISGSLNAQTNWMSEMQRQQRLERQQDNEESSMMSRMVLARMNTLEEGFKDILKEVKELRNLGSRATSDAGGPGSGEGGRRRTLKRIEKKKQVPIDQPDRGEETAAHAGSSQVITTPQHSELPDRPS